MSPKFKFRFDAVLKYKEIIEKKEAKAFAVLQNKYNDECEKLAHLSTQYNKTQKELDAKKKKGLEVSELKMYHTYLNSLNADIKIQQLNVKKAEAEMEKQREKLVVAQKDKKAMEKLKENDHENFKEEERKGDIKVIDEINTTAAARSKSKV